MSPAPAKIAVIEDDASIRTMYQLKLVREGFEVAVASNGHEGLKLAKTFRPDLILLDLRMPEMGGDEMLARLRQTTWGADIKVIVLTNISRSEAPQALRFLQVAAYVVKAQFTPTQVVALVRQVIGGHPTAPGA